MKDNLFIEQQNVEDALYTRLQHETIDQLQQLSGKMWTDFNTHDPGVTIADIANYVLTEVDYKLSFDLLDYLIDENSEFLPVKYGLYPPEDVFPTTPVSIKDYKEALLSKFPSLKNITITLNKEKNGGYNINVELIEYNKFTTNDIKNNIYNYFNANRNLCEYINEITVDEPKTIYLYTEFDLFPGESATKILAGIYWEIQQYLAGSIVIEQLDKQIHSDLSTDQWFEGPNTNNQKVIIPEQKNTETDLYQKIKKTKGVKHFKTLYLVSDINDEESIITNFEEKYTLYIPEFPSDFRVKVRIDNSEVPIEIAKFTKLIESMFFLHKTSLLDQQPKEETKENLSALESLLQKPYRDIFSHRNIAYDFPNHFNIGEFGQQSSISTKDKANAKQLKAYLTLFDLIVRRGLSELKGMKELLSIDSVNITQTIIPQDEWNSAMKAISTPNETDDIGNGGKKYKNIIAKKKTRNVYDLKNRYMNFLDKLYGVNSYPKWMDEHNYYSKTDESFMNKRVKFMQLVPFLTRNRSRAANILDNEKLESLSTIKIHLSTLLDMNLNETISIGSILSSHKLILMNDDNAGVNQRDIINHKLDEDTLAPLKKEIIKPDNREIDDQKYDDYEELRRSSTLLNGGSISGGLFRLGVKLKNYKLIHMNEKEYILAFWNEEDSTWMNLMRSSKKSKLIKLANTLQRYLIELNRQCEAVYVVEHIFFQDVAKKIEMQEDEKQFEYEFNVPFTISFVFSNWSTRMKSYRFRNICRQLIESLVPAHIKTNIYWLNIPQMQQFEKSYKQWKIGLRNNSSKETMAELQQGIYDVFCEIEMEIQSKKK